MRARGIVLPDPSTDPILPAGMTEDGFLGGRVRIRQPAGGYRAAIDPVFLAASVPAHPGERVLEAGAGHGTAAICLASRVPDCQVFGVEAQPDLVRLANDNARLNGLRSVQVMVGDLVKPLPRLPAGAFDHAMANPPYLAAGVADVSPEVGRATANVEGEAALSDWIRFMLRMVRPKGTLTLVHRADRLDEILALLRGEAGGIVVFPLWPRAGAPAKRVIVRARRGIRTPLTLASGLVLHGEGGAYTAEADAVLRGAALDVGPA
jgi:tRNA1(Val) A37 N6-methylase TrmN6